MKSRTLSSKFRVFQKDLTRFAPTWVEYTAVLFIVYYFLLSNHGNINWDGDGQEFLSFFAWGNAAYGFICGVNLFGYLTDPRECNTVHAFPLRREEYFLVHTVAGFLMALVPNAIFILLNIPISTGSLIPHFVGMVLQFVFFYGLAIFCMFLTGRKFAAATLYGLFNGLAALIYWAVETIYLPSLPGVELNSETFLLFMPLLKMMQEGNQMGILAAYAAVGLGLMIVSVLLYRRRKLEYAGDFIAVKWLTPVFLTALSIACGCVLGAFASLFTGFGETNFFLLGMGLAVGYFTGMMLLKRTVRVFSLKAIGGAAVLIAAVFASIFLTEIDPFGVVKYVPDAEDVASVQIRHYDGNTLHVNITDRAEIEKLTAMHADILDTDEFDPDVNYEGTNIHLTYKLKNGHTFIRYYNAVGAAEEQANFYLSQPEITLGMSSLKALKKNCTAIDISAYCVEDGEFRESTVYGDEAQALLETLFRECREGKVSHSFRRENDYSVTLRYINDRYLHYVDLSPAAADTVAMIEALLNEEISGNAPLS